MDGILTSVAEQAPVIAILLAWVYAERKDREAAMQYYQEELRRCTSMIAEALAKHIDMEA